MHRIALIVLISTLLAACGPAAQVPTATPAPPTATPAPPTATPAPPTASPGTSVASSDLLAGVQAASMARSYQAQVTMKGNGSVGAITLGSPQAPAEIMGMKGAFAGADYGFTLSGFVTALYGGSSARGVQARHIAGEDYLHGPIPVIGANQDAWYRLPKARAMIATPPLYPAGLLALVTQSGVDPAGFRPAGHEQLDGLPCSRFSGDRAVSLAILKSLSDSGLPVDTTPEHVGSVESDLWVCNDGYLHQVRLSFAGETPGEKPLPFDFALTLHMFDFETDVGLAAPETALDLAAAPTP